MRGLFIGRPVHWLMVVAVGAALYWLGDRQFHRIDYTGFLFAVLGLAVFCVVFLRATHRRGERVTREPLEDDG